MPLETATQRYRPNGEIGRRMGLKSAPVDGDGSMV